VDFDADKVRLIFSRAPAETFPVMEGLSSYDARKNLEALRQDAVQKLRAQAFPAQVRLLQNHSIRHPGLKEIAQAPDQELRKMTVTELRQHVASIGGNCEECLEKEDLIRCLIENREMMGRVLGGRFMEATEELPSCVCGSSLLRVSGEERTMRCCDKMQILSGAPRDSPNYRLVFERLKSMQSSICFCDLCNTSVPTQNAVWTCKNGDSTILHATSYDVCDECFMKHGALGETMPMPVEESDMTSASTSTADADMISGQQSSGESSQGEGL
jgi:hypothetical protein